MLSSSPLEKFLSSQEALPSDCIAPDEQKVDEERETEVEGQDVARAEKDDAEEVQRVDNVAYDAGYGDFVADHLLSLIEGSVDHHAANVEEVASRSHINDALGVVWRAPGRDDDSSDSDSEAGDDDDDEEEEGSKSGAKNGDEKGSVGSEVNYALYQTVWGVQKWLKKPNLSLASPAEWTAFTKDANVVLKAFESRAFKAHELAQGRSSYLSKREAPLPPTAGGGGGANSNSSSSTSGGNSTPGKGRGGGGGRGASGEGAASCKYLTASRLLRLQVRTCGHFTRSRTSLQPLFWISTRGFAMSLLVSTATL